MFYGLEHDLISSRKGKLTFRRGPHSARPKEVADRTHGVQAEHAPDQPAAAHLWSATAIRAQTSARRAN